MTETRNAVRSLKNAIAFDSRDWALNRRDAWIYGIVLGWDSDTHPEDGDAMTEIAAFHGWDAETIERLRALHRHFDSLSEEEPEHPDPPLP